MMLRSAKFIVQLICAGHLVYCSDTNIFQTQEDVDPAKEASRYLEEENPVKAISVVLQALGTSYSNIFKSITDESNMLEIAEDLANELEVLIALGKVKNPSNLVSILASAQAQKYGVDPLSVAIELATNESDSNSTSDEAALADAVGAEFNTLAVLFPVLPEATSENINGLEVATTLLTSLGNHGTTADQYKKAIFLTSGVSLIAKSLDTDGDGEISTIEAINLSDDAAEALLTQLAAAALSVLQVDTADADSKSANSSKAITEMREKIDAEEGDSDSEKLRNYLSKSQSK